MSGRGLFWAWFSDVFSSKRITKSYSRQARPYSEPVPSRAHSKGADQGDRATTPLLGRILRRVLETAFEKVIRRFLRRCPSKDFGGRGGPEKGS